MSYDPGTSNLSCIGITVIPAYQLHFSVSVLTPYLFMKSHYVPQISQKQKRGKDIFMTIPLIPYSPLLVFLNLSLAKHDEHTDVFFGNVDFTKTSVLHHFLYLPCCIALFE
jgi:hypothetical protein